MKVNQRKDAMCSFIDKSRSLNSAGCTTMINVANLNVAIFIDHGLISNTKKNGKKSYLMLILTFVSEWPYVWKLINTMPW